MIARNRAVVGDGDIALGIDGKARPYCDAKLVTRSAEILKGKYS